jgi:hypothetical protein
MNLNCSSTSAMIIYTAITTTSPIIGVFFGGVISDKLVSKPVNKKKFKLKMSKSGRLSRRK